MTICPHCKTHISEVRIESITGKVPFGKQWNCISYSCPHCSDCLSVQIDPIAVKTDIVDEVVDHLRKLLNK